MATEIETHMHKRIVYDLATCAIYNIPVRNSIAIIMPLEDEYQIIIADTVNKEIVIELFFPTMEECLDDLDRRYGQLEEDA